MSVQTSELPGLVVSIQDGGVAILELNRPNKRNALSQALIAELAEALSQLDRSPTIFAVVLTSSGPFCGRYIASPFRVSQAKTSDSGSGSKRASNPDNSRGVGTSIQARSWAIVDFVSA